VRPSHLRWSLGLVALVVAATGHSTPVRMMDVAEAQRAFSDFQAVCGSDRGQLWGVSLCGPLMLVDPQTRALVTNGQPSGEAQAVVPGLFVGVLPSNLNVANTATSWAGVTWAQVRWPLPRDAEARRSLLVHEAFHRVQEKLGMPAVGQGNAHLDTLEGRVLLQLEWRALRQALLATGVARRRAVEDALVFRQARRDQFPGSAAEEKALELYEGLAEYTGIKLASAEPARQRQRAVRGLEAEARAESFVRSFAYGSGPAYGLLLDAAGSGAWRQQARAGEDLGELLRKAMSLQLPQTPAGEVVLRAKAYDGETLRSAEVARDAAARQRVAAWRKKLVEGPVLRLPLQKVQIQFDPGNLVPLGEAGTVYPTARLADDWGTLTVTGGVLVDGGWKSASVAATSATQGRSPSGDGWELQLNPGWSLEAGERQGDLRLRASGQATP
jgi:hypothetical protein